MKIIKIGERQIGAGKACFIIAEVGSNHDQKLSQAFQLIDVAKKAGADAVKFQSFSADKYYSRQTPIPKYLKKFKLIKPGESMRDLIERIQIPKEWYQSLAQYCREQNILFLSTPFNKKAIDELEYVGVPAYKIASFEITHLPLLEYAATKGKPIILSTGMADLADIELALNTIHKSGNRNIILLHCAVGYPPKYRDLNLRAIETMRQAFQLPIGFSDHTLGTISAVAAVSLGACMIEKHFTLNRRLSGPDHPFALEPDELKIMIKAIRDTEKSLGSGIKKRSASEEELYRLGRRSLVANCNIPKGTKVTRQMLGIKRPGYGIHPKMISIVIGRIARTNIKADDILTWEKI